MKQGKIHIGKFTKEDSMKVNRRVSREMELENATGWVCKHKVYKSDKDYTRKVKHKQLFFI